MSPSSLTAAAEMQTPPRPPERPAQTNQQGVQRSGQPEWQQQEFSPQPHQQPWPNQQQQGFDSLAQDPPDTSGESEHTAIEADIPPIKNRLRQVLVLVLALAVVWLLRFQVLTIKNIHVTGTSLEIWQSVADAAGLNRSPFYFSVNESRIRDGINANRYLIYESMNKIFPNTLQIKVQQRRPYAFFTHLGIGYVLAMDGMILEQTRELKDGEGLIQINGLAVWGQQSPGAVPSSTDPAQMESLQVLFRELAAWDFAREVSSIDIAQSLALSVHTRDGYSVNLGSADQLHAKIGTVASVVQELKRRQLVGGVIEATRPGEATYLSREPESPN